MTMDMLHRFSAIFKAPDAAANYLVAAND